MALFNRKNIRKENTSCCNGNYDAESMAKSDTAKSAGAGVKVLGSGCASVINLKRQQKQL